VSGRTELPGMAGNVGSGEEKVVTRKIAPREEMKKLPFQSKNIEESSAVVGRRAKAPTEKRLRCCDRKSK